MKLATAAGLWNWRTGLILQLCDNLDVQLVILLIW